MRVQRVDDAIEGAGPLAGVAAGLAALSPMDRDAAFVVSCDHPLLRPSVIRRLIQSLGQNPAVVLRYRGWLQPLIAVYRLSTTTIVSEMLRAGEREASKLVTRCGARIINAQAFADVDPGLESFLNVNDPADYQRALRAVGD